MELENTRSGAKLLSVEDSGYVWWGSRAGMREERVESYKVLVMF